jgi:hypothetical protein
MANKTDTFVPEIDGKGRVVCPVDAKTLKRINSKPKNTPLADALKAALAKQSA